MTLRYRGVHPESAYLKWLKDGNQAHRFRLPVNILCSRRIAPDRKLGMTMMPALVQDQGGL
jgi:hypothetical protein